jgi:HEAT repeat protein
LLSALSDGTQAVQAAALQALQACPLPALADRLLALLTPAALDVQPYRAPATRRGGAAAPQQAASKVEEQTLARIRAQTGFLARVLAVLGTRPGAAVRDRLLVLHRTHPHPEVRAAATQALLAQADPVALEALAQGIDHPDDAVRHPALEAALALPPAVAYARLAPCFDLGRLYTKEGQARADEVYEALSYVDAARLDPRWADRYLALLDQPSVREAALGFLTARRDPRLVVPLVKMLDDPAMDQERVLRALTELRDRRAVPALVRLLESRRTIYHYQVFQALRAIDDPGAVPALQALAGRLKRHRTLAPQVQQLIGYLGRTRTQP